MRSTFHESSNKGAVNSKQRVVTEAGCSKKSAAHARSAAWNRHRSRDARTLDRQRATVVHPSTTRQTQQERRNRVAASAFQTQAATHLHRNNPGTRSGTMVNSAGHSANRSRHRDGNHRCNNLLPNLRFESHPPHHNTVRPLLDKPARSGKSAGESGVETTVAQ